MPSNPYIPTGSKGLPTFIIYAHEDGNWARWLGVQLALLGFDVELDQWSWRAGDNFVIKMNEALSRAEIIVGIYSSSYFNPARYSVNEMAATYCLAKKESKVFIPVLVEDVPVPPLSMPLLHIRLVNLSEAEAISELRRSMAAHRGSMPLLKRASPKAEMAFAPYPGRSQDYQQAEADRHNIADRGGQNSVVDDNPSTVQTFDAERRHSANWPIRLGRPPLQADAFQDRAKLRDQIDQAFVADQSKVITEVITGDGGTGKTQLSIATYSRLLRSGVELALWITATSRTAIVSAYAQAASRIGYASVGEPEDSAVAFLMWLKDTEKSWLIVLDDLADPSDVTGLWPEGSSGRVLVTTRRRDAALAGHDRRIVSVDVFTPVESLDYLTAKLSEMPGSVTAFLDQAPELAADLGHLPLALNQAAAVIANDAISCARYRSLLADRSRRLADIFVQETGDEYARALDAAWSLATERADNLGPKGHANAMALLLALLDPNGVPEEVVLSEAVRSYLALATTQGFVTVAERADIDTARRALRNLYRLSMVGHDIAGGPRAVRMHALPQRAIREHSNQEALGTAALAAAHALLEIWPAIEVDPAVGQALRASTDALVANAGEFLWPSEACHVLLRAGRSLGESGLLQQAIDYFHMVVTMSASFRGADDPITLTGRHELAYWRGEAGDAPGAARAFEELLRDRSRVLGPDHPDTLTARGNLAYWRGEAGDRAGAGAAFSELLNDVLRVLGPDHPDTLTTRGNLYRWQGQSGELDSAVMEIEQLLADRVRLLGTDHPDTLATRSALARWRGAAGAEAETVVAALEDLLRDRLRVLGADHIDTLSTRYNVARWKALSGDTGVAVAEIEELLSDFLRIMGPDNADTQIVAHNLRYWRQRTSNTSSATAVEQPLVDRPCAWTGAAGILVPDRRSRPPTRGS